ncbi:hypothetical protein Hs30E_20460 [Lactococcus hodotermopsidis]|uniref:Uncharacterized protein n=1 Tax=Pseudolactococcus hodotermopsidis TaxID=2709157 RepID=A0A6A0BID7_9LACT|nr:hypothetical protein [Lactococcus hodotermopsidis]GFH43517.1 hypothetical protein Hs30E_20460 [Lactococcus hodotermopsidis]
MIPAYHGDIVEGIKGQNKITWYVSSRNDWYKHKQSPKVKSEFLKDLSQDVERLTEAGDIKALSMGQPLGQF